MSDIDSFLDGVAPAAQNESQIDSFLGPEKSSTARRVLGDGGVSVMKGLAAVPESLVGIADVAAGGRVGKAVEDAGIDFKGAQDYWGDMYSPEQKLANENVAAADGFVDKLGAIADNPSVIPHAVVESVPAMFAGGFIGKGVKALPVIGKGVSSLAAGAIGEGSIMAGGAAENMRQQTEDGLLNDQQQLAALGTGVVGAALGAGGAAVGKKLGLGDIDTAMVDGTLGTSARSMPARIAGGAAGEGLLEEMPQSGAETALENYGMDRPLDQGVGGAMAMGAVTGAAMGGAFGALSGQGQQPAAEVMPEGSPVAELPPAVDLVQPTPTPENPAPAPVVRPDPNAGPLSAAASLLPAAAPLPVAAGPLAEVAPLLGEQVNPATGEVMQQPAPAAALDAGQPVADQQAKSASLIERGRAAREQAAQEVPPEMLQDQLASLQGEPAVKESVPKKAAKKRALKKAAKSAETEEQLREQLAAIEKHARGNGGWNTNTSKLRAELRTKLDAFDSAKPVAATPPAVVADKVDPIQGQDIDGDWASFSESSGTLNVPRAQMPQIKAEHRGAMVNFLNARGVTHEEQTVPATSLKPTQAEFSREKVAKAKGYEGGDRSILVSSDGHVLDGHHQWLAKREAGDDVKVIRLGAPISDLLGTVAEFPSATQAEGATASPAEGAAPDTAIAEKATAIAVDPVAEQPATDPAPSKKPAFIDKAQADHLFGTDKKREAALGRIAAGKAWFMSESKANDFVKANGLADTHAVMQDNKRFEVREKAADQVEQSLNMVEAPKPASLKEGIEAVRKKKRHRDDPPNELPDEISDAELAENSAKVEKDWKELTARAEAYNEAKAKMPLPIPEAAFSELMQEASEDAEGIPYFTAPAEMVRSEKRAEAAGVLPAEQAAQRIAEWEAHAKAQRKTGANNGKVVLSLFDTSGEWSQPWVDAGYDVHRFDIQDGMDVNDFSVEYLTETLGIERADVILAAPPCTDFSVSGAHAWAKKDADGRTAASVELVRQTLRTVEFFKPAAWAMENPVGRIATLADLPKALMSFQPANFGNPYTKRTLLWGDFNTELPLASVEATEGSKMTTKLSGKDKYERSLTPKGFAYSFFMANNLADLGALGRLAGEFKGFPKAELQTALDAGMSEGAVRSAIEDSYNDQDLQAARDDLAAALPKPKVELKQSAPADQAPKIAESQFAGNKVFTADAVEKARARMKSKLGQLNSGIDPELMMDGMTIAGAYIESGMRSFAQYAKAMVDDMGDGVKPYLLSFWEAARHFPGVDKEGMTSVEESARLHAELNKVLPVEEAAALGSEVKKPAVRTKKNGTKGDTTLTQDWGVDQVDGHSDDYERESGNSVKDQFIKDAAKYLGAVADTLREAGYQGHPDKKGLPSKPVSKNEGGVAGSGDITLTMRHPSIGTNVYVHIGESALRGVVPMTPSGIAVMYRVSSIANDQFATKNSINRWSPVDLSAADLAAIIMQEAGGRVPQMARPAQEEKRNEQPANGDADQGRAQAVRGAGSDPQQGTASADPVDVAPKQPADGGAPDQAGDTGRPGLRQPGTDVAAKSRVPQERDAGDGREGAGRSGSPDAGAGDSSGAGIALGNARVTSPAAASELAQDLIIANPLEIVGGTPVQRFNRNRAALELLQSLEEEGRQATPEEQKTLAGYIGWGSFGQELFQGSWDRPIYRDEGIWKTRGEWLRETLGESAWKSAQRSITNAHYTDPPTVMAMWDMVKRMGFTGGKIQEPSMGTGNFYSMMPADIKARSQLTGIELDETTGAIAKQLFPKSNIRVMGYEQSKTPDGFYDLIIGNWPFENTPVADRRYNKLNPMLHDYFFLKTLDQVRAGGIVIGITSAGSMDKQNTMIRRELARNAELVAAIRLPSGAFQEYAGTKVVTDIVVLRKRPERLAAVPGDATWTETTEVDTPSGKKVRVNQYFAENPQHIIGTLDFGSGTTTFQAGMIVHRPENMAERLQQAVDLVPAGAFKKATTTDHITYYANATGERHGALAEADGKLMVAVGDQMVDANERAKYQLKDEKKTAAREAELRAAVALRKLHTALVDADRQNKDAEPARKALREAYNSFTKAYGPLRDSFAITYMDRINDPFYAELAALENDDGKPATVMSRSTTRGRVQIESPSVRDAYVLARNQSVNPSIDEIAKISGKSAEAVKAELLESGAVFSAPNGDIVPSDIYLSGNVREKMREAEAGLAEGNKEMSVNIEALKAVMPEDVPYFNIETKLGATWVSPEHYAGYIAHMLSRDNTDGIEVAFKSGRWDARISNSLSSLPEARTNYGTGVVSFGRLVQAAMSNQSMRLKSKDIDGTDYYDAAKSEEANARISKIRDEFGTWLWSDAERRVDMEREYNEARNAWATPKYDGSFLTFEGMALSLGTGQFQLRQHQVNAIWRAIVNRRSLNAHEVGTGKTFTMGGIAIESRRYGIAKKPVILAHNANSASVAAEIRMMYPNARVLYIDNLEPSVRAVRMRQIANDDWDAIVIPHSLIDRLSLREETLMQMAADDIAALEAEFFDAAAEDGVDVSKVDLDDEDSVNKIRSVTAKELAKARKRIIENIKKQSQASSKEGAIAFEDLGIDMILVDEVHEFKKPPIVTRMQMKGLNTSVSNRSIALQFLTRYVRQMNNGGNVHTFTGTPITNTITEIYHQMRYVMESEMAQANVADWDGWFGSFATEVSDVELTAAGEYEIATRLAGFVNVPELRQMVGQYMDTVFAEDMPEMQPRRTKSGKQLTDEGITDSERTELLNGRTEGAQDRPYKQVINASADMSEQQITTFQRLQKLAREWRDASGKQRKEWSSSGDPHAPIVAGGIADKASFDARLIDDSMAGMEGKTSDDPTSKASRAVANVLEIYKSHPLAGQVIFSDMGFNKVVERSKKVGDERIKYKVPVLSTMQDIVERLVQGGIPRAEIAMVTGATKKEQRHAIAKAMNTGAIRVVLGSTDTLGVGVNMQRNLRAMHHLDAPHMPGELEQRNGRGLRQGNQWNTVLEYRYMTERLDGKRWQILAIKQRFINAFMKAKGAVRVIEGEAAADEQSDILESFSEAAGDPRILQRVKMQKKLESLQRKERMFAQGVADMRRTARNSESRVEQLNGRLKGMLEAGTEKNIQDLIDSQRQNFTATIDGITYDKRADAIAALADFAEEKMRVGEKSRQVGTYGGHPLMMEWGNFSDTPITTIDAFGEKASGKGIAGAEAKLRNFFGQVAEMTQERDRAKVTADNMAKAMNQPFGQAADLDRITKNLADLEQDLAMNPVPPPAWLRQGAPIDSEVFRKGRQFIVTGHRYGEDGWFVIAEDEKGSTLIPYLEATDGSGMRVYEEREFVAPEVMTKAGKDELTEADKVPESTPNYRANSKPAKGIPLFSAKAIAKKLRDSSGLNVVAVANEQALPADLQAQIKRDGMGELVAGVYHNGTSYLIASNLQDAQHAIRTVLHEAVGHGGVKAVLGSNIAPVMRSIYSGMPAAMRSELERRYAGQTANLSAADAQALIAEEYVAHLAEHDPSNSVLDRVVALVRKFIRELFGAEAAGKWSRGDIVQLLAEAKRAAAAGKGPDGSRYRESSAAEALAALPDVSEADEAEFVASLGDGQARAFAGALYKARGTESPFFKSWFGKSRMIDKQGQPITFVHRSYGERDSFTDSDLGKNTGTPTAALGHYLARKDVGNVERYGPVVERFYIRMAKPKVVTQDQFQAMGDWSLAQVKAYRETLIGQGFDGMYVQGLAWPIVFDGKNIKAVRNAGTFDATASTRYSLVTRQPFNIDRKAIAGKIAGKLTDWKPAALGALPLQYLRDFAPKSMTALGQYIEEKRQMDADRNEMHTRYDAIAQRWLKLRWGNRKAEQALADLMHAATLAGIDPSKGWLERYHPEQRAEYNRMAMQFKALPAEHQAMFRDARDAYKAQIKSMEDVIEENIRKSSDYAKMRARRDRDADIQQANDELTGEAREEAIEKAEKRYYGRVVSAEEGRSAKVLLMRKKFESMRVDEPYFPLKRFGEYFVALRDGKDLVSFSMFESAAEMNEAAEQMRKTYPGLDVKVGRQSAKQELEGAVDPAFVVDLQELVSRLPNSKEVSDQIYQMYLNTMPDFSMRKGFIHRKKTAGFNRDALRTFSSSMFHSSYQIARMKHSLEMNELVEQIEDEGRAAADPVDGMTIANEMRKRHEWVMNPKGGSIAQHITSAAFVYQLGATPAAAFVNTTQTWMMGVPVLGTRFGSEAKALAALGKASKDFIQGRGHIEKKLAGSEAAAFAEFLRMGLIDKTQAHDLAGVGETGVEYNPVRHKVMGYISWMFHNAERYNREVTVMAGYRMGREAGLSHEAAIKEAAELTWTIHFDYSSGNRARYMQSDTAKILLVFRQHSVNMLSRLVIDIRQAMKGESKQVKAEAKRRLAGMFAMFAIFAGAMGVPGMQAILMLLNAMDDDDDPWTAEDKIKRAVTEAIGEDMAKVFFNGVPGAVTGVSLTDRIGMGSLWFWSPGRELEGQDAYYYWMEQVLGAAPAMVGNAFTGLKMVSEGNVYRGVETMMPKAIKDVMRSGRYADEGLQTMGGDTIIDELGAWEVVSQAMGFTPAHVAEQYDRNSALKNAEQHVMRERRSLMNGYAMATRQGDTEKLQEIRAQIADFNSRYSSWKITGKTLMQSNRSSLNSDRRTVDGIVLNKKLEYLRDQQ